MTLHEQEKPVHPLVQPPLARPSAQLYTERKNPTFAFLLKGIRVIRPCGHRHIYFKCSFFKIADSHFLIVLFLTFRVATVLVIFSFGQQYTRNYALSWAPITLRGLGVWGPGPASTSTVTFSPVPKPRSLSSLPCRCSSAHMLSSRVKSLPLRTNSQSRNRTVPACIVNDDI